MRKHISALGRSVRHFPRTHLLLSGSLVLIVTLVTLLPESGESRPERPQTLNLNLDAAGDPPVAAKPAPAADTESAPDSDLAAEPAPPEPTPQWETITVAAGDTLGRLLQDRGVTAAQVHRLVTGDKRLQDLKNIRPGQTFEVLLNDQGELQALKYKPSRIQTITATLTGDGTWQASSEQREYQRRVRFADATINSSLFLAGQAAGMSDNLTMQLANIFGWDVDFVLDIRPGDRFRVLFEELYLDGEKVGEGDILAAEFWNRGRHLTAYQYQDEDGAVAYLDAEGNSMRKAFIRTPVAFSRISSGFNPGRRHPVLNTIRAHKGTDYAAPSGTPIKAAGKGKVIFAGVKGGYGNVIIVQHGRRYTTLYAHMRGFAKGIRVGTRVNQGQTIGYVGSSGLATGPHLHYEFRIDGVHRNPQTVPLPKAQGVSPGNKEQYLAQVRRMNSQMTLFAGAATLARSDVR